MSRLRVGVIGLGVGEQHLRAYLRHPACEVAAICDLDAERLQRVSSELPGVRPTSEVAELIEDETLDVLSIASFDDVHASQAVGGLRAGKHVFVEKPLCRSMAELRALKQAVEKGDGLQLASNLVLRAAPLYRWVEDARDAGRLGRLYAFDGDYLYGRLHKITDGWRGAVENYSVMLGGGIHLIDLMLGILGERPVAVSAAGNRIATESTAFRQLDFVAATFSFPSGVVGRVTANFGCVHRHQHVVRVFGTEATLLYDDAGARLHESRDPAAPPVELGLSGLPAGKGELIPGFIDAILESRDTTVDRRREFDVISACIGADRALAEGGPIDIEYA